jgi:uncharacterized protein (DUF2062 family)
MRDKLSQLRSCLCRLPDSPDRTAAAFAIGVCVGFSPFLGLQTLLGITIAYLLGLSRVAVLLGTWVNLPWIVPLYYALATELGSRLLGVEPPSRLGAELRDAVTHAGFGFAALGQLATLFRPLLWPFVVGSTLGGVLLGVIAHRVMLVLLRTARRVDRPGPAPG